MRNDPRNSGSSSTASGILQSLGIQALKVLKSTVKLAQWPIAGSFLQKSPAISAKIPSNPRHSETVTAFAPIHANPHGGGRLDWITSGEFASAARNLPQTGIQRPEPVRGRVLTVTEAGTADKVYDITVEDQHEFFADGILVLNCIDALRYALEGARRVKKQQKKDEPVYRQVSSMGSEGWLAA